MTSNRSLISRIQFLHRANRGPLAHIPGPWYTKFTSWPFKISSLLGDKAFYVHKLHQKYGPVVRVAPDEADICDVSAKQTIYSTKEVFLKTEFYYNVSGGDTGNLFATRDVDKHRYLRRLLSSPLSDNSLKAVEPVVRRRIDLAIQRMEECMKRDGFVDVFHWSFLMMSNIIGELSFGESFGDLETGEKGQYLHDLHNVDGAGSIFVVFPWVLSHPILFAMASAMFPAIKGAMVCFERITQYAQDSLGRYRQLVDEDPVNVKPTLFTKLFKAEDEETLSFEDIVQNARAYLVAGADTATNTLTYLIWAVCKNREIRDRLVAELTAKLPETNGFTDADVRNLPYLNGVIDEALRLYAPGPAGLPRTVPPQGANLAGYSFPGGVAVTSQAYSLHRDPSIYPDPDRFDPDRWAEGRVTKVMRDANMSWGGGARGESL